MCRRYTGRFNLTVRADLAFGKTAKISITVAELQGRMRLGLRHFPTSHWYISFVEEPTIQFEVESVFEGATVPQLSMLIVNQIRRSVRNKHTLPAARMRYAPLFTMPSKAQPLNVDINGRGLHEGGVAVRFFGVSELKGARAGSYLYCELSNQGVDGADEQEQQTTRIVQFEIDKSKGEEVDITFKHMSKKQTNRKSLTSCIVDKIECATKSSTLKNGDIITHINGTAIISPKHALRQIHKAERKITITATRHSAKSGTKKRSPSGHVNPNRDLLVRSISACLPQCFFVWGLSFPGCVFPYKCHERVRIMLFELNKWCDLMLSRCGGPRWWKQPRRSGTTPSRWSSPQQTGACTVNLTVYTIAHSVYHTYTIAPCFQKDAKSGFEMRFAPSKHLRCWGFQLKRISNPA